MVILRIVVCGELASAIAAVRLGAFPENLLDGSYVGFAAEEARRVQTTPARTARDDCHAEHHCIRPTFGAHMAASKALIAIPEL